MKNIEKLETLLIFVMLSQNYIKMQTNNIWNKKKS